MNPVFKKFLEKPIFLLIAVNLIVGLFVFRDYGFSWDEPLFYDYGNALGYAYSPREWFSGHFDVANSYGSSGDDHKTRGPAYLFLAREPVYLLQSLGLDQASAWHLVNFLFFQLGIYFLYRLATRWMNSRAALIASALFAWQPLLWGHAFINPKDPPFLTFFLASVCLGFEMVDAFKEGKPKASTVIFPAIVLGITTSIRILGPLAGFIIVAYFVFVVRSNKELRGSVSPWLIFFAYGAFAILIMFITWPYLWEDPIANFIGVFRFMSDNPTNLSVLFDGQVYRAGELPRRYLPFMLATTFTEPVWFLFMIGIVIGYWKLFKEQSSQKPSKLITLTLTLSWFVILIAYVILRKPAMYDGIRHFLFIVPPIFILSGFAFEFIEERICSVQPYLAKWLYAGFIVVILFPGIFGVVQLHPYEYTYYNSFIGGTQNVFRNYETDFWLTCYKEAVQELDQVNEPIDLFVHREAYIAAYYANENINVYELRGAGSDVQSGDYILVNTRSNEDLRILKDISPIIEIKRGKALFCIIKRVP